MKLISEILSLTLLVSYASALVIHDLRPGASLEARSGNVTTSVDLPDNSYGLGVNILVNNNCGGTVEAVRNHDVNSCNAGTSHGPGGYSWRSAYVKEDGVDHGHGCMTIWETQGCSGKQTTYYTDGGQCINFDFVPLCVVVAERYQGSCPFSTGNSVSCRHG